LLQGYTRPDYSKKLVDNLHVRFFRDHFRPFRKNTFHSFAFGSPDGLLKDAGLIAAAQRVEHYEMAGYGTARTYAELLGDQEGARLLALTLEEERQTDQKLSELAKSTVNIAAAK
jgi:Domain of unknown function (DUF892)